MKIKRCYLCKKVIKDGKYGTQAETGKKFCYDCAALLDWKEMQETGKATLYLAYKDILPFSHYSDRSLRAVTSGKVTNFPGTLSFPVHCVRIGRHNIAKVRYDFWFIDHDNKAWHGVQYGDNTQLAHCKRVKLNH